MDWGKKPKEFDMVVNTTSVGLNDNEEIAIDFSINLKKNGFEFLHFYTLNQSELALSVCKKLNIGYL